MDGDEKRVTRARTATARSSKLEVVKSPGPADLRPAIRTEKAAEENKKSTTFKTTCSVALIPPLPGWTPSNIRCPVSSDDENEDVEENKKEPKKRTLTNYLKLTPSSEMRITNGEIPSNFNAQIIFGDEGDESSNSSTSLDRKQIEAVHKKKAGRALTWLEDRAQFEENLDSSIERENKMIEAAVKKPLSTSFEGDLDTTSDEKSRRKSVSREPSSSKPKKRKSTIVAIPAKRNFFQPRNKKDDEDVKVEEPKEELKVKIDEVEEEVQVVEPQEAAAAPEEAPKKKPSRRKRRSFELLLAAAGAPEGGRRRRTMFPCSSQPAAAEAQELVCVDEVVEVQVTKKNCVEEEAKEVKKSSAVHHSELDYAPIPKLHYCEPIQPVNPDEVQHLPPPAFLSSDDRHPLPVITGGPFPAGTVEEPPRRIKSLPCDLSESMVEEGITYQEQTFFDWAKGCDSSAPWTEAFCPSKTKLFLGDGAKLAKDFITKWKKKVIREEKEEKKKGGKKSKDSDDDSDYEDEGPAVSNPLILCGPSGCGKSALIACLAEELNMKIIEVQPGDKRNAAALKKKLSGAGESHLMQSGPSIASFFGGASKPAPAPSVVPKERTQTLIVVEHVDIYFPDEDKDYWITLKTLAAEAKVPVIWTCETFPEAEIYREPALQPFETINMGYSPARKIAQYVNCILLACRHIDTSIDELEQYVTAHNCNLRAVLANIQIQTASVEDNFIEFPQTRSTTVSANVLNGSSCYTSWQQQMDEKRLQYHDIVRSVEGDVELNPLFQQLSIARRALNTPILTQCLAVETIPFLTQMDRVERQKRAKKKRRYQHYFEAVRGERSIDSNGELQPAINSFSWKK